MSQHLRRALRILCRQLVIVLLGVGTTVAIGQVPDSQEEESKVVPGARPGRDAGALPGVGQPPLSQGKLQATEQTMRELANDGRFHLIEASISDIHAALQSQEITCESLVRQYFTRIKTYSGQCVSYDKNADGAGPDYDLFMPSGKGVILGVVGAIPNAKKVNAYSTLNLRPFNYSALGFSAPHDPGPRSETDLIDTAANMPDALEVARQIDRQLRLIPNYFRQHPLACIPIAMKDQMETFDMRTTDGSLTQFRNDRPPNDGTLVAKLRAAGAIIIGKANMDEYAGGSHRSSYGGQICNPYATDRDGGSSSTGSASAPSANLAVCGIAEESGGSIHGPAARQGIVGMTASRGLVSRFGTWSAELIRERYGPECRNVADTAKVLDVIRGYDSKDPITATQLGLTPKESLDNSAHATTLRGKRLGIVREFMPKITVNDEDAIRVFDQEVIPALQRAGATLIESINPRDIAMGWSVDNPAIPNMDIQSILAEMVPTLEPAFANPSTVAAPNTSTGLLPNNLRVVFDGNVPALFPAGTDVIQKSVEMFYDKSKFPDVINLRKLSNGAAGAFNQGRFGLDKMLVRRNDPQVKSVLDLSIDFLDLNRNGNTTEHISYFMINANGEVAQRARPAVTPGVGVPATPNGPTLDTQGEANHLFRQQAIREIVSRIMADNNLDALVYPFSTLPPKILTGTPDSIAWLAYDGRPAGGYNSFTDASGLPAISVPAGYTKVVYDRTTRGSTVDLALNPPSVKRDVTLPFSIVLLGRLWSEPTLFEIASAYENVRGPRKPPTDFSDEPVLLTSSLAQPAKNVVRSDAAVKSSTPASDSAAIRSPENDKLSGRTASEASHPVRAGRIYAEVNDAINTGVVILNPNASPATLSFSFAGPKGEFGSGSITIPANGQISKLLDQYPFNSPAAFQGLMSFTSDLPVGVTTVRGRTNERNEFLSTALPQIDNLGIGTAFLPYFAAGDDWSTELILVNPTYDPLAGTVRFSNVDGGAAGVTIAGRMDTIFDYAIPARATQKLVITENGPAILGSIRVVPADSGIVPAAFAVFANKSNGVTVSEAAVSAVVGTASQ